MSGFRRVLVCSHLSLAIFIIAGSTGYSATRISPLEAYHRAQAVFSEFELSPEIDFEPKAKLLDNQVSREEILALLPYFDPWNGFGRFSRLSPEALEVFQDRDSRTEPDFSVKLNTVPSQLPANSGESLSKLRIAIDPGHMGDDLWDKRTDKFIVDSQGRKMSEGLLALQTALLLERELKSLGAEVLLTRRELRPVADLEFADFDLAPYAQTTFRESSLLEWFQQLLTTGPAGPALFRAFRNHTKVREIFSEEQRLLYFTNKVDLDSRAQLIEEFSPDITLILHFDTAQNPHTVSSGYDGTKAYVAGAFLPEELSTGENRFALIQHLAHHRQWRASVELSSQILSQIRTQLKIPLDSSGGGGSIRQVAPGVFARNLVLTRKIHNTALAFLECFFYNDPREFKALSKAHASMNIGGRSYPYSERLVQLTNAIRDGVLRFSESSH